MILNKISRYALYSILLLLMILSSCNQENAEKKLLTDAVIETSAQPKESTSPSIPKSNFTPPQTILLSERPKPITVDVPTNAGGSYLVEGNPKETKIDLVPAEVTPPPILYPMQNFTTADGLNLDAFWGGTFDRAGNLWLGTDGAGATKYDGQSFTNYSVASGIPHVTIWRILEDKKGNLWFISDGSGVAKYNGMFFTIYTTADGLSSNHLRDILEDKAGNIWFTTDGGGVNKYDGKSFTAYTAADGLANNKVFGMAEDRSGNLWFATMGGGVSKFDGKSFTNYTIANGLVSNNVRTAMTDRNGNLWFGTELSGVSKYDGKNFNTFTMNDGLASNHIFHIMEDKTGHIWFATDKGASEYDGKSFINYSKVNGLNSNDVRYIIEDKPGNMWFTTYGGGLYKYSGDFITNYMIHAVRSTAEDKIGNLWFSTEGGGVFKYNGESLTNYTVKQGLSNNAVWSSFVDSEGKIWFGTEKGITVYDGKSFTIYTTEQGLISNWTVSTQQDKEGNYWISTANSGLSKFDGKSFTNYTTEQGLAHNAIRSSIMDKKGNLWLATDGGGLSKYDGKVFTNYTTADGLISDNLYSLMEDSGGNFWIGSIKGISRFDGSTFLNFSTTDGLPDNGVVNFAATKEHDIAIGTQNGIAILKGYAPISSPNIFSEILIPPQNQLKNEELKKYKPVFEIYNIKTGYPIKDNNLGQNGIYLDSKGILWIATGSVKTSLVRMDYSALNKTNAPPNISIQSLKINNENVIWSDLNNKDSENLQKTEHNPVVIPPYITEEVITFGYPLSDEMRTDMRKKFSDIQFSDLMKYSYVPENLKIPHSLNNITVDFGAIEPALPQDVLYQYKLEGYNQDWSPPSNNSRATFGNIFEGNYQLKVKAQSPFGVWSEPITYTFKVLPPWFRTWWAYSLYAISSLILLYVILLWRTATLRKRQKVLEKTVTERTTELVFEKKKTDELLKKSDELLLNILPVQIAEELKEKGSAKTQSFESVTILFTDFKNFTTVTEKLSPKELVEQIDYCYRGFERIIRKYHIEKIKTIGDSFMAVGGLPVPNTTHAKDVVNAALEIATFMENYKEKRKKESKPFFGIRIGIHTGPVIAGVVGSDKFAYDVWGDAVNLASRMESSDEEGRVNISENTYRLIKDDFEFIYRGKIAVKGKGEIDMYFVTDKVEPKITTKNG